MNYYSIWDIILLPIYLGLIFMVAYFIRIKHAENPAYDYFMPGLFAKIAGSVGFCLIYTFYYDGGDTTSYFHDSQCMISLATSHPHSFLSIMANNLTPENFSSFDNTTMWPEFYHDYRSFSAVRLTIPFSLLGAQCFLITSILVSISCYTGLWCLYLLFYEYYPKLKRELAFSILFMPSVLFWGSGILKDSYTMGATAWLVYGFYKVFIKQEKVLFYGLSIIISVYILSVLKPYIFYAIALGIIIWISFERLNKFRSKFLKTIFFPIMILIFGGLGAIITIQIGSTFEESFASIEGMLNKAVITQQDLRMEYYGGNSFDIGTFDASFSGIISKAPQAITAGLFRPFIWESKSAVMVLSGLENLFLLIFTLRILIFIGIRYLIKVIIEKPFILIFAFAFTVTFAFSIGLTTANFGALVRYKIPLIPFFTAGMFIINYKYKLYKLMKENEK